MASNVYECQAVKDDEELPGLTRYLMVRPYGGVTLLCPAFEFELPKEGPKVTIEVGKKYKITVEEVT